MIWPGPTFPIAIDFDGLTLYALQLKAYKRQFRVNAWFRQDLDPAPESINADPGHGPLADALTALGRARGFKGRRVAIHLPADRLICFPAQLDFQKNEATDQAILNAALKNLPYDVREAVIDYPSMEKSDSGDTGTAMICAARQRDVMDLVALTRATGFCVDVMDFLPLSILRLHQRLRPATDGPCILCHIGRNQSSLMVVHDHEIHVLSKFNWGRDSLATNLDLSLGLGDRQTALHLLKTFGVVPVPAKDSDRKVAANTHRILGPAMETLVFEFQKVLGYTRAKKPLKSIKTIFFYGLSDQIHGLADYIQNTLNIPVDDDSVGNGISALVPNFFKESEPTGLFTPTLGLALRTIPWL